MTENFIWGIGAITVLILIGLFAAIFGGVEKPHRSTSRK